VFNTHIQWIGVSVKIHLNITTGMGSNYTAAVKVYKIVLSEKLCLLIELSF